MDKDEWYIAYLDLLGVSDRLYSDDHQNFIDELKKAYKYAFYLMKENDTPIDPLRHMKYRVFSDNIVMAVKCGDDEHNKDILACLILLLSTLQAHLLEGYHIPLRGAVCRGEINFVDEEANYFDDLSEDDVDQEKVSMQFVIGSALPRLYKIESKFAIYPRIILDDCIVEDAKKSVNPGIEIVKDFDGRYMINYFFYYDMFYQNHLSNLVNFIDTKIDELKKLVGRDVSKMGVLQKYEWIKTKLDDVVKPDYL